MIGLISKFREGLNRTIMCLLMIGTPAFVMMAESVIKIKDAYVEEINNLSRNTYEYEGCSLSIKADGNNGTSSLSIWYKVPEGPEWSLFNGSSNRKSDIMNVAEPLLKDVYFEIGTILFYYEVIFPNEYDNRLFSVLSIGCNSYNDQYVVSILKKTMEEGSNQFMIEDTVIAELSFDQMKELKKLLEDYIPRISS